MLSDLFNANEIIAFFLLIAICYFYARIDSWAVGNKSIRSSIVLIIHGLSTAILFACIIAIFFLLEVIFAYFFFMFTFAIWLTVDFIKDSIMKKDIFS